MKKLKVLAVFLILIISFSGLWTWKHRYQLFSSLLPKKGDLKVLTYSPTKEEVPISTDGITIMFDRAMVPLTTLDQGKENAIPLEITPEVEGSFHWLGTHGFIFRPKNPLRPATKYTITLPAGIPSEDGFRLKEKLQWEFTTILPRVESFGNKEVTTLLPKKASITLRFNMEMNRKDVEEKLSFSQSDTPLTTQRKYEWLDDDHILQITFTENLPWGATIKASLPEGVLSARGTLGTSREYSQTFMTPEDTMKITRVWAIHDYQDEKNLKPSQEVHLKAGDSICYEFSQGINKKSFEKAFHAQSSDDTTAPYFYFSYYDSFSTMSAKGPELLEGYKQACAVFLEKFNQSYTFSVKPEVIESLSGAPLKTSLETYKVKTDHATPQFFSNLTKNIISYKGPMQLHYRSLNLKSIQAKFYRLSKNYYSENIRNWGLASEIVIDSKTKLTLPLNEAGTEIDEAQMKADYHQEMALTAEVDQTSPLVLDLNQFKEGKPLPGIYLLEISGSPLQNGEKPKSVLSILQLTSVGIATKRDGNHLLVWTTDLETGQPISTSFHVEAKSWNNGQKEEVTIPLDGVTDSQGLSLLNLPATNIDRFCVEISSTDLASYSCDPLHQFPEYHYPMGHGANFFAYMYTDRPIYRPGQKVYFSSFVREVRESRYLRADPKTSCELNVTDAAGTEIYIQSPCVLGNAGIVSGQFDLENREDLPRGTYEISIKLNQQQTFTRAFQVTSYRKPSFKVDVQTKEKEIISGDTLKADVVGSYYFGSPLRKSPTRWSIMTSTYLFSPEGFSDYNFIDADLLIKKSSAGSEDETYSSEFEYDVVDASYENKYSEDSSFYDNLKNENQTRSPGNFYLNEQGEKVQNTSKLSEKGILNIEYKTDLKKYPTSQILSVEASVSDPSHQEVSSMEDIIVHKGSFYLGIKPNQWIYGEKEKAQLSVVSLDTQGKKSPRKSFSASLIRRDYKYFEKRNTRGFWELVYEPQDVSIKTISEKTDEDGKANLSFDVPSGGFYRVVLKANDHGNEIQSAAEFSAWGSTYVPWHLNDAEKIELVPDKSSYKIGDTAKVLIKSLVPMTKALLTYERGHLLDSKIIDLGGKNAPYIEVPIMEGMIPNFYLSVVAHAGRDTTRPPLLFYGETELHIEPESKRLMISLMPDRTPDDNELPVYKPGESVKVHVETKDPQGKPQKAHVIVSVADESVLKLLNYQLPDLIKKFYYNRDNNVKSTSSLFSLKAGDGGTGQSKKRRIFKDTAHFEAYVMTNDQGHADFTFKLPDDLTTWVIEAVGISESKTTAEFDLERQQLANHSNLADLNLGDKTFVGSQRTKILSTQPVVMRTAFPRFLVWGDTVRGNVIVTNRSSQELSGKVHMEIKGSTFEDNQKTEDVSLTLLPHEEKILPTNLKVGTEGKTSLSVSFLNEKQNFDSLEVSWPVLDRFAPEVTASSGVTDTLEKEALLIPPNVLKDRGGLDVSLKASLSMATASSMRHLIYYPFGCSEQKSATLLAYLMSDDLSEALGETYFDSLAPLTENEKKIPFSEKMKLLEEKTQDLIDELEDNFQNSDGGMKYWPSSFQSDVFASAQVFWALSLAQQLGFSVDDLSYSNLKSFLSKMVQKDDRLKYPDTASFVLWALSLQKDPVSWPRWVADELLTQKNTLSISGVSYLMMAYQNLSLSNEAKILQERLASLAVQDPRHTSWPASHFFGSSPAKNTSLAVTALLESDPQNPLVARGLGFLFFRKKTKISEYATQDDLALSWMSYRASKIFQEAKTDFSAHISLEQKALLEGAFDERNLLTEKTAHIPMNDLPITPEASTLTIQKSGTGTAYYDMSFQYYLPTTQIPTREEGLIVSREYYALDDVEETKPLTEFKVGENYKGHITLIAPQDLNYVFIHEKLPSGFEPIDMTLSTTSKSLQIEASQGSPAPEMEEYEDSFLYPSYDDVVLSTDYGMDYFFSHQEVRDDAILWSNEFLPAGTFNIRYPIRATTAGSFLMPGVTASEFYEPEIFARGRVREIVIKD